ncbi:PQQ-dependent sugar dehydrogenase, partial [Neisseria sp. P0009.S004]|uniref:PQQ-dependent sugar dehydrogenase n=1 Tax=Neisseria sp. P0009.S004 TaxID=3436711 RepID=UPI003F822DE9
TGLQNPWGIGFLPTGEMLVTEKAGRLRILRGSGTGGAVLESTPIAGTPPVVSQGQGALMEVLPHPRFAENRLLYITYSKAGDGGNTTALFR